MVATQSFVVSNTDVFSYLKRCLYNESIDTLRRGGKEIRSGVFYETVRMIEKIEDGLTKIEENIISNRIAYEDSDDDTKEEIIRFLNLLRLDKELIQYAEKAHTIFSIQVSLFCRIVDEEFPVFYVDGDHWTLSNIPLQQIFDCIAKYRQEVKSRRNIIKDDLIACNKRHIGFVTTFNKIIKKTKKVYILNLMIEISPNFFIEKTSWDRDDIDHVIEALRLSYKHIVTKFHLYADFVNTFMGVNESLNFHLICILRNDSEFDSKLIALRIWNIINRDLNKRDHNNPLNKYDVKVQSLNEPIEYFFKPRHVAGVLGYRPKKQLEDFNAWYLYLFAHAVRFIQSDRVKFKHLSFDIYEVGYRVSTLFHKIKNPESPYRPPLKEESIKSISLRSLYRELVDDKLREKIFKGFENKKEYEGLCQIYDEQKHFFEFETDTKERFKQLELFIQYLKQTNIPAISTVDAELKHIVQSPKRYLSLFEKLAIILLLDHYLDQGNVDHLTYITKGTLSPSLNFFLNEHKKNRDVVNLSSPEVFSLSFYKLLHKYLHNLKDKINKSRIATEQAKGTANRQKNYKSVNQYLCYQFKQDVDVYRFKMTCKIEMQNISEVLLVVAFSEIWTAFVKDVKRKSKFFGKQLIAHVGVYISLTVPIIDVTLIFKSDNQGGVGVDTVEKLIEFWKNYLTDETKSQLIHKLQQRKRGVTQSEPVMDVEYKDFLSKLSLQSIQLPLIMEKRKRQGDYLICNYKDKKQRSKFIKMLAEYYSNYSLVKRESITGSDIDLNLMLKGRLPQSKAPIASKPMLQTDTDTEQRMIDDEVVDTVNHEDEYLSDSSRPMPETKSLLNDQELPGKTQSALQSEDQSKTILNVQNIENSNNSDVIDQVALDKPTVSSKNRVDPPKPVVKIRRGERKLRRGKLIVKEHEDL
ncbi:hypothetical protein [Acinetobacter bereziniae]|uniref:hypothetical protein n=1 Tax=Acinetobacter bereziniae TaxID=106648 RepID=UPI0019003CE6|nr:hypothetical protein [Acinetobacter bereziniae]MBJ9907156.1 hypothetical protein [Acinetobacter bereziniae]MBJ9928889.1 hypothetical protein [Acinetobacter bereziniae]